MATAITEKSSRLWIKRLAWLLAIWAASVASLFGASVVMRGLMRAAGLGA